MTPQSFGDELRNHREKKKISLEEISTSTRISLRFLEAIERGNFTILPVVYIRAFLREYAAYVGLEPAEVLATYEKVVHGKGEERNAQTADQEKKEQPPHPDPLSGRKASKQSELLRQNIIFGTLILLSIVLIIYLYKTNTQERVETPPKEISFDQVVRETEAASQKPEATRVIPPKATFQTTDSLLLQMETLDSVWVSITIDGKRTEEFLFPPQRKWFWKGEREFALTMGNAGGATFRLNGVELGTMGKRGSVIRNILITAEKLKKN